MVFALNQTPCSKPPVLSSYLQGYRPERGVHPRAVRTRAMGLSFESLRTRGVARALTMRAERVAAAAARLCCDLALLRTVPHLSRFEPDHPSPKTGTVLCGALLRKSCALHRIRDKRRQCRVNAGVTAGRTLIPPFSPNEPEFMSEPVPRLRHWPERKRFGERAKSDGSLYAF